MIKQNEDKLLQRFGKRIAEVRKSKGMTQSQLAERVNMSVVTIAYIETGKRWVRLVTLDKIARALGVSVAELFRGL
ncbi:MAG TPA: helix-turn-helix transcriptional regulator [Candidatus Saccharimonadales bacterium]|nr:helix-turn-helix transcriptional regulator [Candidatus Saccharimonadales bacterium]